MGSAPKQFNFQKAVHQAQEQLARLEERRQQARQRLERAQGHDQRDEEFEKNLGLVDFKRGATYNVCIYNCTTFATGDGEAAGKTAPDMTLGGICLPDLLCDGIKSRFDRHQGKTMVSNLDTTEKAKHEGPEEPQRRSWWPF